MVYTHGKIETFKLFLEIFTICFFQKRTLVLGHNPSKLGVVKIFSSDEHTVEHFSGVSHRKIGGKFQVQTRLR